MVAEAMRDITQDLLDRKTAAERRVTALEEQRVALEQELVEARGELIAASTLYDLEVARWERGYKQVEFALQGKFADVPLTDAILSVLDKKSEMTREEITDELKREGFLFRKHAGRSVHFTLLALKHKGLVAFIREGVWAKVTK